MYEEDTAFNEDGLQKLIYLDFSAILYDRYYAHLKKKKKLKHKEVK